MTKNRAYFRCVLIFDACLFLITRTTMVLIFAYSENMTCSCEAYCWTLLYPGPSVSICNSPSTCCLLLELLFYGWNILLIGTQFQNTRDQHSCSFLPGSPWGPLQVARDFAHHFGQFHPQFIRTCPMVLSSLKMCQVVSLCSLSGSYSHLCNRK